MKRQRNKKKLDLSRTPGEADAPYRARILSLVGVQDGPTREAAELVAGACLDVFASSVSHAEFVGWCGTAGHPREVHIANCRCPARLRRHFLAATQREEKARRDVIEAQRVLRTCARETARLALLLLPPKEYGPPPVQSESGPPSLEEGALWWSIKPSICSKSEWNETPPPTRIKLHRDRLCRWCASLFHEETGALDENDTRICSATEVGQTLFRTEREAWTQHLLHCTRRALLTLHEAEECLGPLADSVVAAAARHLGLTLHTDDEGAGEGAARAAQCICPSAAPRLTLQRVQRMLEGQAWELLKKQEGAS